MDKEGKIDASEGSTAGPFFAFEDPVTQDYIYLQKGQEVPEGFIYRKPGDSERQENSIVGPFTIQLDENGRPTFLRQEQSSSQSISEIQKTVLTNPSVEPLVRHTDENGYVTFHPAEERVETDDAVRRYMAGHYLNPND